MDMLHSISRTGLPVVNHPSSIEKAVDKYHTLALLSEKGIQVPETVVTENVVEALRAFHEFGEDVVVKPVFGSRGIGMARISNKDVAERTFRTLRFNRHVLYVQRFVQHGDRDIRVFVIGGRVVAAMLRVANSWKTNVSKGATPTSFKWTTEIEELAIKSSAIIGTEIAGIDLLEGRNGPLVSEINSQPGWRGLQSTTQVNLAEEIAHYIIERAKR
jgi:tetrahydromethanopterin:alpha-L-glutamate ligase